MREIRTDLQNRPMLIGIAGKKQSGKDTMAQFFKALDQEYEIKKFAGKLKEVASLLTNYPLWYWEEEKYKDRKLSSTFNYYTGREFLQRLGTEVFRNNLNNDIWVNLLFQDYGVDKWIITDVRFQNEVMAIKENGGILIKMERKTTDSLDTHISENLIDNFAYDYIVKNDGNPEELFEKAKFILEDAKIRTTPEDYNVCTERRL